MSRYIILIVLLALAAGCAGNGKDLDENGNPIGNGNGLPVSFEPTFANIQNNVFTPICTRCHVGAAAPRGLRLDEANAYNFLVNIDSNQKPELKRVEPGDPDNSYIVRKLEGGPDIVGSQMPLNQTPLSQETINAIRVWIARGAPRD